MGFEVLKIYELVFVCKKLSNIILIGENFFNPFSLQSNLGLSLLSVLYEIKMESFLYLKKWVNLSVSISVILFVLLL